MNMLHKILVDFGLNPAEYEVITFGSGLINHTYKVSGKNEAYILQQLNHDIFKSPTTVIENLTLIQQYLKKNYPEYLFAEIMPAKTGDFLILSASGKYYRLFPFISGSCTINYVTDEKEAYEAARQFGKFTFLLKDFDVKSLKCTLDDFHNLQLRFEQFKNALNDAKTARIDLASEEIKEVYRHIDILQAYNLLIEKKQIPIRVIHHDTKISNVLFDDEQNGLCVIDMDTVMPGYFLSDVGDMMRTYLSAANEEETDFSKIIVRKDIFAAICSGYMSAIGNELTELEKQSFIFSGELMIYMQAIRFLTDFLNDDRYYQAKYELHNLNRAKNQFRLLKEYLAAGDDLCRLQLKIENEMTGSIQGS